METIRCSPIIICRTKYIDYPTGRPFCCPEDLSLQNFELLISMMNNGQNLSHNITECKIFINDNNHCIIGKYGYIEDVIDKTTNFSLDFMLDNVKPAWGFIGAVIKTNDFISFGKSFDLLDSCYTNAYIEYLYKEHWLEHQFTGTYHYPYVEETVQLISTENSEITKSDNGYIIETDDKNSLLFSFAVECALKGEKISFCTNAEYNASRLISENKVDIVTVSTKNLGMHKTALQKPKKEIQKEDVVIEKDSEHKIVHSFDNKERIKSEQEEEYYQEQQQNIRYCKFFGMYWCLEKTENNESLFEIILGNRRFFCTKQLPTEKRSVSNKTFVRTNNSNINVKSNLNKDKYKF